MERAMGFAALAILTVIPLLILVAGANSARQHGLGGWVVYGMSLTGSPADAVRRLFSAPARVLGSTSVFSAVVLSVFGVAFGGSVQAGYERIWGLHAGPWHKIWRQAVWVVALIAYIYAAATVGTVTYRGWAETAARVAVAVVLGIAFFWWGLRFLVGGRVSYLAAMPGAVATIVGLAGLRVFSGLVFEPLIASNAVSYGALAASCSGAGSTTPGCRPGRTAAGAAGMRASRDPGVTARRLGRPVPRPALPALHEPPAAWPAGTPRRPAPWPASPGLRPAWFLPVVRDGRAGGPRRTDQDSDPRSRVPLPRQQTGLGPAGGGSAWATPRFILGRTQLHVNHEDRGEEDPDGADRPPRGVSARKIV